MSCLANPSGNPGVREPLSLRTQPGDFLPVVCVASSIAPTLNRRSSKLWLET